MSDNYFLHQNKDNINITFPPNKPLDDLSDTLLSGTDDHELDQSTDCRNNSDRPEHRSRRLDMALRSGLLLPGFTCPVFHTDAP
jgi:hypothetical protein